LISFVGHCGDRRGFVSAVCAPPQVHGTFPQSMKDSVWHRLGWLTVSTHCLWGKTGSLGACRFADLPPVSLQRLAVVDVQLGKTTVNWKQRTLRFLHLVLAIENTQFSLCALFTDQTEHKRSTRSRLGRAPALAPPTTIRNAAQSIPRAELKMAWNLRRRPHSFNSASGMRFVRCQPAPRWQGGCREHDDAVREIEERERRLFVSKASTGTDRTSFT
jgi:hypothetical protein